MANVMDDTASPANTIQARYDGRESHGIRPVSFQRHFTKYAPGSVLMKLGETQVLVTASIEDRVPRHVYGTGEGWLTAEYAMLPGATHTRNQRERLKVSGRTQEIQRLIGRSLRACLDFKKLGERSITIDADVIQADGGTRTASITAGYIALQDAITGLLESGHLKENPILFPIAAVSLGVVSGNVCLDLNYEEDSSADVDANLVMNETGDIIEFQLTSEKKPLPKAIASQLLTLGETGIQQLFEAQRTAY